MLLLTGRKGRKSRNYLGPNAFQLDPGLAEAVSRFKRAFRDLYETPRIQVSKRERVCVLFDVWKGSRRRLVRNRCG